MGYVDGFVLPVPSKNIEDYTKLAKLASKVWIDHGALQYIEAAGDDLDIKEMGVQFPALANAKKGETVVFAFIVFKNRAHRDKVNAKVMKDPRLAGMCSSGNMPFDMKRMAYGGFKTIVKAAAE